MNSIVSKRVQEMREAITSTRGIMAGLMLVTGFFTGGSVFALWAPDTTIGYVIAIFPALVMIALAEGMFLYTSKLLTDGDNFVQKILAATGLTLALATIVATDAAAAVFLAKSSGYISLYTDIPEWAQVVVTYAMPVMAIVHGVLLAIYEAFDEDMMNEKIAMREMRQAQHEAKRAYYEQLAAQYRVHAGEARDLGGAAAAGKWMEDRETNFTQGLGPQSRAPFPTQAQAQPQQPQPQPSPSQKPKQHPQRKVPRRPASE